MALCNFGPSLPFTNAICKGYFCPKQWKATKKLGNSNAHPQRFWVCTRCWHTMSKFVACLMAFVFWGQLALWLGAKFWTIAYPSLLWKSLTTSNWFHLLKQHWRQLLQLTGLNEEFEPKMHWSLHIIVKVSRGMANYLHAGPWKGSTKALENMGMSCATLLTGKLL